MDFGRTDRMCCKLLVASLGSHCALPSYGGLCPSDFTEDAERGHGSPRNCKLMSSKGIPADSPPPPLSALEIEGFLQEPLGLQVGCAGCWGSLSPNSSALTHPDGPRSKSPYSDLLACKALTLVYFHHHRLGLGLGLAMPTLCLKSQLPTSHLVAPTSCLATSGADFLPATTTSFAFEFSLKEKKRTTGIQQQVEIILAIFLCMGSYELEHGLSV